VGDAAAPAAARPVGGDPSAAPASLDQALDDAEAAYRRAVDDLETSYRAQRGTLDAATARRLDARFAAAHAGLADARRLAGEDPEGRVQALRAYGRVIRALQSEANAVAEARP
jgi:hypothetical protein